MSANLKQCVYVCDVQNTSAQVKNSTENFSLFPSFLCINSVFGVPETNLYRQQCFSNESNVVDMSNMIVSIARVVLWTRKE